MRAMVSVAPARYLFEYYIIMPPSSWATEGALGWATTRFKPGLMDSPLFDHDIILRVRIQWTLSAQPPHLPVMLLL